jgi:hypothetical protein
MLQQAAAVVLEVCLPMELQREAGHWPWVEAHGFCFRIQKNSGDICSPPYMHGTAIGMDPQPNVFVVNLFIVGNNEW